MRPLTEDDKIKQQKDIAQKSRDPNNIKVSVEQIKGLGKTAIATDGAFVTVTRTFETFVIDHGSQFPKLREFLTKWQGYHSTWKKLLRESRDFASTTSGEYRRYDEVYLKFVQAIKTKEDLEEAITALTKFSESNNTDIPLDFANKFRKLGEQVKVFRDEFDQYLKDQGKALTEKVKDLQEKLKVAEETAKKCDESIRQVSKLVEFIPIVGLFAQVITELCLPGVVTKRDKAAEDAKLYKKQIDEANKAQEGLANMQTKFAGLDSEFQIICEGLAIFAQTWQYFHDEAKKFSDQLKTISDVKDIPQSLKSSVDLARAISTPLQEGLDAYSQVVVIPP